MGTRKKLFGITVVLLLTFFLRSLAGAADITIALHQAQAGDARKYQPLLDYMGKKGLSVQFHAAQDYQAAAEMFSKGTVDAMFSGSGIAGIMMIKDVAYAVVRPIGQDGVSTYAAVIVASKGSPQFTGSTDYFNGKRVIFSSLASAGEIYFHSLGKSKPKEIMKAANHGAALDTLARGLADIAIVKNHVWNKEKGKYPQLEAVYEDKGQNPDGPLIVSRKLNQAMVSKISSILLGLQDDTSAEATQAKDSLKIREFVKATDADFKHTMNMLKKAGVTKDFAFKF